MKNGLKIIVLAFVSASSFTTTAQSFNISGGMNLSSYSIYEGGKRLYKNEFEQSSYSEHRTDIDWNTGFNASFGYEFKLSNLLSLETGLSYSTKGFTLVEEEDYTWGSVSESSISKEKYRMNYLDLPIVLNVGFNAGNVRMYGKLGGYVGFGMLGNIKTSYEASDSQGATYTEDYRGGLDLGNSSERFNYGLITGIGAEYKNLFMELKYSAGRVALWDVDDYKVNSYTLGLSIGYKFKKVSE